MTATDAVFTTRDEGPAVERIVAIDLVKRGAVVVPILAALAGLVWGLAGLASVAFAGGLVLVNFWLSASLLAWAARVSYGLLMGVALFGFLVRIALIASAVWLVRDQGWVRPIPLGLTLVVTHLGLLLWETRYVSASLAFPALKPSEE